MSQDLICLFVAITAAIVSGVAIFSFKFIRNWNGAGWNSNSTSPKTTDLREKPSDQSNFKQDPVIIPTTSIKKESTSEVDKKDPVMRAGVSPFNLVQLHSDPTTSRRNSLDDGPKEVDVTLDIRKAEDNTNNFDVKLRIVADPESEDPMKIQVDATFDKEMNVANVRSKAKSEAEGSVKIEGKLDNKRKIITLDPKKDSTRKMVLRKR